MARSDHVHGYRPDELGKFPRRALSVSISWFRGHRAKLGAWYFSSAGGGRFDVPAPAGTCYLADSAQVAARELIGPDFIAAGTVPDTFLADRVVSEVRLPEPAVAGNLADNAAFSFGVTNELSATSDYRLTQAWAQVLHRAGFSAVLYRPRFTPGDGLALGLFGESGPQNHPVVARTPLSRVVATIDGVRVVRASRLRDFDVRDEPIT